MAFVGGAALSRGGGGRERDRNFAYVPHQRRRVAQTFEKQHFLEVLDQPRNWQERGAQSLRVVWQRLRAVIDLDNNSSLEIVAQNGETLVSRYRPESLDHLTRETMFSREELKAMYRGFKQECPTGMVSHETFKGIFAHFFPQGDSDKYSRLVFNVFDTQRQGFLTFEQFVIGLSFLSRGTLQDRLKWTFNLYDSDRDGMLTKSDISNLLKAVYSLLGHWCFPSVSQDVIDAHAGNFFTRLEEDRVRNRRNYPRVDADGEGVITLAQYLDFCLSDETITASMLALDTAID